MKNGDFGILKKPRASESRAQSAYINALEITSIFGIPPWGPFAAGFRYQRLS